MSDVFREAKKIEAEVQLLPKIARYRFRVFLIAFGIGALFWLGMAYIVLHFLIKWW